MVNLVRRVSLLYYNYRLSLLIKLPLSLLLLLIIFSSLEGDGRSPFLRGDTSINVVSFSLDMSSWLAVITVWRYWKINNKNAILNFYTSLEKTAQSLSLFCFVLSQWNVNKFWNILCCLKERLPSTSQSDHNCRIGSEVDSGWQIECSYVRIQEKIIEKSRFWIKRAERMRQRVS